MDELTNEWLKNSHTYRIGTLCLHRLPKAVGRSIAPEMTVSIIEFQLMHVDVDDDAEFILMMMIRTEDEEDDNADTMMTA